ncbi:hypothetical protein NRO40_15370 [Streptomyces changanensis]|uniref:Uncharacterized protein n=2 Tax=Streptomyces TaxID=1883 RepID=A0ABY5N7I6_9ACTN|nr:hypothetical protein [Streptomyces changanensis]UUS32062.1 hypothetical protein NRO40_15370 [Streptomyces changanensis]
MKNFKRALGVGGAVLACVMASATTAHAAPVKGTGKAYYGCTNTVYVWKSAGKVHAYAQQDCKQAKIKIMRPTIALSGNNGKQFVTKGKACTKVNTCRTPTVTLKANKGWTYRASNAGTGSFAQAGAADFWWPTNTVAHASLKG